MYIGLDLIQKPVCQMCSMFTMWHALMTKNNIVFQMHTPAHTSHNFNANTGTSTSAITQSSNMNLNPLLSNIPMYPLFCFSVPLFLTFQLPFCQNSLKEEYCVCILYPNASQVLHPPGNLIYGE